MSDYWVSRKKYFCKYCDIYIADDAPSRQQHENGLRHKGNKDRFIRELYKSGEKKKKEKAEEEREMKMIDAAAQAAFAKDVGHAAASAAASPSSSAPKPAPAKPAIKSGDKWANYTTAAELGIVDVEAELAAAQYAIRQKEGRVGGWSTVTVATPRPPPSAPEAGPSTSKRVREPTPDAEEDTRRFKVRQRAAPVGLGQDVYDPGEIRVKKRDAVPAASPPKEEEHDPAALVPQWRPTQWRRAGEVKAEEEDVVKMEDVKVEPSSEDGAVVSIPTPPAEQAPTTEQLPPVEDVMGEEVDEKPVLQDAPTEVPSLFKKRKIKSTTAGGRKPIKA